MSVIYHGTELLGTLVEHYTRTIEFDEVGVARGTCHYTSRFTNAAALVDAVVEHPDFPFLKRKSARVTREEGDIANIQITFEGISGGGTGGGGVVARTTTITNSLSTEPIETHPNFTTHIGGVLGAPLHNAIFEETGENRGKFKYFPVTLENGTTPNPMAGVTSYLMPSITFEESMTIAASSWGTYFQNVGKAVAPPAGAPSLSAGQTWLFLGGTGRSVGDGVEITRKWRSSGTRGWNLNIYGQ